MEKIEALLEEDERILWKHVKIEYILRYIYKAIIVSLFIPSFILIFFLLIYLFGEIKSILMLILFCVILLSMEVAVIFIFYEDFETKKKSFENIHLNLKDYKKYNEMYIITNKRWFHKHYGYTEEFICDAYSFHQQKDEILFFPFNSIKIIRFELKKRKITFFNNYDLYIMKSGLEYEISSKSDFQELVRIIKDTFPIEKEELHKKGEILFLQN